MPKKVLVGKFGKTFGILGWLKINSFTNPIANIIKYKNLYINKEDEWVKLDIESIKSQDKTIIAKLKNCNSPEEARIYTNNEIYISREQLPSTNKEYYWIDLEGLRVVNTKNVDFGIVDHLIATGSNDVLVVKNKEKERLVPYLKSAIVKIDLENKLITVDWDEDF